MTEQNIPRKQRRLVISEKREVPAVREEIASLLPGLGFGGHDIFAVRLATEEALLNAIEHGNKNDKTKRVTVAYFLDPQKAEITVTDEGAGFDPITVPDCTSMENLAKCHGRGIALIRGFMDIVEFGEKGNRIRLVKFNSAPGGKPLNRKEPPAE